MEQVTCILLILSSVFLFMVQGIKSPKDQSAAKKREKRLVTTTFLKTSKGESSETSFVLRKKICP